MSTNTILASAPLTSTGYHLKANGTTLGNSLIWDNGTNVGIGNTNTSYTLDVSGTGYFSGIVGIGVAPSAWYNSSGYATLQVGNASLFGRNSANSELYLSSNAYDNTSGNPTYITTDFAARYVQNDGVHSWLTAPSGTAGNAITFVERLRITSAGLIYNSNPPANDFAARFVGSTTTGQSFGLQVWGGTNSSDTAFRVLNASTSTEYFKIRGDGAATFSGQIKTSFAGQSILIDGASTASVRMQLQNTSGNAGVTVESSTGGDQFSGTSAYSMAIGTYTEKNFHIGTNSVTRLTVTSGGSVGIGTTNPFGLASALVAVVGNGNTYNLVNIQDTINQSGVAFIQFLNASAGLCGYIARVSTTNAVNYVTTSDYRLKEDLQEIKGLEKVLAIKVYDFKWKDNEFRMDGVLAHELQEIIPFAVSGEKDAINEDNSIKAQGVDYSKIVPTLIKAIQEMNTKLDEQNQTIQNLQEQINILAK